MLNKVIQFLVYCRYCRVCSDLGLRTRAVEALIVLLHRGLPPSIAGEEKRGEAEVAAAEPAGPDAERGTDAAEESGFARTRPQEGTDITQARGGRKKGPDSQQQHEERQREVEGAPQHSTQPWRDTPAGFGNAEERHSAAAARSGRGSSRQSVQVFLCSSVSSACSVSLSH